MLFRIMKFLNRIEELTRLDRLAKSSDGGLALVYGRRRIGKTRLLVEWRRRHDGLYTVADQSAPGVARRHLAEAIARRFAGFAGVDYRDWEGLFSRLSREAREARWRGPVVFDELPYWTAASPELPSVLQRWIDHEARDAGLTIAVAGSSQRMMQGLALDRSAPLFGRAREVLDVPPLDLSSVQDATGRRSARQILEFYTAWGGVPRYWELAVDVETDSRAAVDGLVLDPRGPLHREPDRLLLEEIPSALEARPVLDAIGAGAHRVSEIAGRLERPATSLSRPLARLIELGFVTRDVPFGEAPRSSRRSQYRISDPFTRLWFRVVAPHRGELVSGTTKSRRALLDRYWQNLVSACWEDLCRDRMGALSHGSLGAPGDWKPASRWWSGNAPEWDVVAEDVAGERLLFGEVKLASKGLGALAKAVVLRPTPPLPPRYRSHKIVRALFVPGPRRTRNVEGAAIVTLRDLGV